MEPSGHATAQSFTDKGILKRFPMFALQLGRQVAPGIPGRLGSGTALASKSYDNWLVRYPT
jgi:hypothetical protein